jgi:5-methylcytosine-specific restriction endonuclease McrA
MSLALYTHARWRKKRKRQLQRSPLCEWCAARNLLTPAAVAHHAKPHQGDRVKFWARTAD